MNNQELWKISTILRALLMGMRLEHQGRTWCMDANRMLCVVGHDNYGEEHLLIVTMWPGIALSEFVDWALTFTDDQMEIVGANITLNEIRRGT